VKRSKSRPADITIGTGVKANRQDECRKIFGSKSKFGAFTMIVGKPMAALASKPACALWAKGMAETG